MCFSKAAAADECDSRADLRPAVTDIHMHVVPGVDDGARTLDESCEMLRLAAAQGIKAVFATPHNAAFLDTDVRAAFRRLQAEARARATPIELYLGCELRISAATAEHCVRGLADGTYPTMGDSRCVLAEFTFGTPLPDYLYCLNALISNGYTPILAHMERYAQIDLGFARALRNAGALVQINAYSIADERDEQIKQHANLFLAERYVDFIGTDAHRTDHRPPLFRSGMNAFRQAYSEEYAALVTVENPRNYLAVSAPAR